MKGILIFIAAAVLLLFLLLLCSTLERRRFVIRKQNLHLSQLPQAFDGLRLVQLSDLHKQVYPHGEPRPFDPTVCAEHARMRLHGCPGIQSHTDGEWFQAAVPAFRIPPNSLRGFPVPSSGTVRSAPHRPSDTYSLRQKIRFAKGVWANSPLCSLAPKNFQKFCAVSTLIFFLSMTYLWNIF